MTIPACPKCGSTRSFVAFDGGRRMRSVVMGGVLTQEVVDDIREVLICADCLTEIPETPKDEEPEDDDNDPPF